MTSFGLAVVSSVFTGYRNPEIPRFVTSYMEQRFMAASGFGRASLPLLHYFTESSPIVEVIRTSCSSRRDGLRVGVAGLGIGALSYYRKPKDEWRYYEIDPLIGWLTAESGYVRNPALARSRCLT